MMPRTGVILAKNAAPDNTQKGALQSIFFAAVISHRNEIAMDYLQMRICITHAWLSLSVNQLKCPKLQFETLFFEILKDPGIDNVKCCNIGRAMRKQFETIFDSHKTTEEMPLKIGFIAF